MSLRNAAKTLKLFTLCGLMLIPAVYLWYRQRFFMPAPLHACHKYLRDDCSNCHKINKGVDTDLCAGCHKFPKKEGGFDGFAKHHKYNGDPKDEPDLDCFECHTGEHPKPKKDKQASFLKAEKEFVKISCSKCHDKLMGKDYKYSYEREGKAKPESHIEPSIHAKHEKCKHDCRACHEAKIDSGKEKLHWNCDKCHDLDKPFEGLARHHTYSNLDCVECHTEHKGKRASLVKADANRLLANCEQCHGQDMGKGYTYKLAEGPLLFDHSTPSIHKKHEKWKSDCKNCHDKGILIYRCTNCHDPDTNEPHVFEGFAKHHTYTELKCLDCHTEHKGPSGETTTIENVFTKIDCAPCHAREMGSQYEYTMTASKHPENSIHESHKEWRGCDNCHQRGTPNEKCVNCHDPKSGEKHVFEKVAQHHTDSRLDCVKCHTEHRGLAAKSLVRQGIEFDRVECSECHHDAEMEKAININDLPKGLTGSASTFSHQQHPISDKIRDCEVCHEHRIKGTHVFEEYSLSCTSCHHADQGIPCEKCHAETDRFYRGIVPHTLLESRPDSMSGVVKCEKCHVFDEARRTFDKVREKCVECHTADYGDLADYWKGYLESEAEKITNELAKLRTSKRYADYIAGIEKNLELVKTQGIHNWEVSSILIKKLKIQIRSMAK